MKLPSERIQEMKDLIESETKELEEHAYEVARLKGSISYHKIQLHNLEEEAWRMVNPHYKPEEG